MGSCGSLPISKTKAGFEVGTYVEERFAGECIPGKRAGKSLSILAANVAIQKEQVERERERVCVCVCE